MSKDDFARKLQTERFMKKILVILSAVVCLMVSVPAMAQDSVREAKDSVALVDKDTLTADSAMALVAADLEGMDGEAQEGGGGLVSRRAVAQHVVVHLPLSLDTFVIRGECQYVHS